LFDSNKNEFSDAAVAAIARLYQDRSCRRTEISLDIFAGLFREIGESTLIDSVRARIDLTDPEAAAEAVATCLKYVDRPVRLIEAALGAGEDPWPVVRLAFDLCERRVWPGLAQDLVGLRVVRLSGNRYLVKSR
jgi:hypothetical protein